MAKIKSMNTSIVTLNPSFFSHLLFFLPSLSSPKKNSRNRHFCSPPITLPLFFLSLIIFFTLFGISILSFKTISSSQILTTSPPSTLSPLLLASLSSVFSDEINDTPKVLSESAMAPLPLHGMVRRNVSEEEREFWEQPDGEGLRPCLDFSIKYRRASSTISKEKKRFLAVRVAGGLNKQRNQIIDAVVIARILEAALVVPVLEAEHISGDESKFSELFDVEHFKKILKADVRVVSSLPSTHVVSWQTIENKIPNYVPPLWIRARFFKKLNEEGVLVLKGLDSKLSKNLPPDLQKLRCKVAFHALRFATPIRELGNRIARRMWIEGPYIAVHLRLEKDVWIKTGCSTGLGPEYDSLITKERESHPDFLSRRSTNLSYIQLRLAGHCPFNAFEVARILKALGAARSARVYVGGGEPFGGSQALQPLVREFPNVVTKEMLAQNEELKPYTNMSTVLAAIDYTVSLSSDVFLPTHDGHMAQALQGHRAYVGNRKFIKLSKQMVIPLFEEANISDAEFSSVVRKVYMSSKGQLPELRAKRRGRDVIAYPVAECMCKR